MIQERIQEASSWVWALYIPPFLVYKTPFQPKKEKKTWSDSYHLQCCWLININVRYYLWVCRSHRFINFERVSSFTGNSVLNDLWRLLEFNRNPQMALKSFKYLKIYTSWLSLDQYMKHRTLCIVFQRKEIILGV